MDATVRCGARPSAPGQARRRRAPVVALLLIPALILPLCATRPRGAEPPAPAPWRGRPLAQVLRDLRQQGLNVLFSTAVVTDDLIVVVEPDAGPARRRLDQILAPHGLQALSGPGDAILIVRDVGAPPFGEDGPQARFVEEIDVTTGRLALVQEDPDPRTVVTRPDAILVPATGGDVSRVVAAVPGVAAADHSAALHLRGADVGDLSIVLDGLELYEPYHLREFQSPFSFIDGGLVDRIDLLASGFTVDLGDRHGGFVRMSSRAPGEESGTRVEIGTINSGVTHVTPATGRGLLVAARAWYPEAVRDTTELGQEGLDPRFADLYFRWEARRSPRSILSAHGLLATETLEFEEPDESERVDARGSSGHLWLRDWRSWSARAVGETVLSLGRFETRREGVADPEDEPRSVLDDRSVNFGGLRHDLSIDLGTEQLLRGGFGVRWLDAAYRYRDDGEAAPGDPPLRLDPSGASLSAWVAHRFVVAERLATEYGVRWDRQSYVDDDQLSPRLNLVWRASERTEVRAGLGWFFQSQRIHELDVPDGETTFLPAERSRQVALSLEQRLPAGLRLRLDAYDHDLTRLHPRFENLFSPIELFPETEPDRVSVAPQSASLRGLEVLLQSDPARPIYGWVGYARSAARDRIDGRAAARGWDQPHAGRFLIAWREPDRWSVSLTGAVHTGWPTTPVSGVEVTQPDGSVEIEPVLGERNADRLPTYARLDARVTRTFAVRRGRLHLTLDVTNLTDRDNSCCVDEFLFTPRGDGTVETERRDDFWLGATPSFTVLWEF